MTTYHFKTIEKRIPGTAVDVLTFINGQVGAAHRKRATLVVLEVTEQSVPGVYGVFLKFREELESA